MFWIHDWKAWILPLIFNKEILTLMFVAAVFVSAFIHWKPSKLKQQMLKNLFFSFGYFTLIRMIHVTNFDDFEYLTVHIDTSYFWRLTIQ